MAGQYDSIIKENIRQMIAEIAPSFFGFHIREQKDLKDELQTTVRRDTDFILEVTTDREERFILHVEFQSENEDMRPRMHEYFAMLRNRYRLPVRQYVLFLSHHKPSHPTTLDAQEVYTGFEGLHVGSQDVEMFLRSDVPEQVLLGVLADFGSQGELNVLEKILRRLQQLSPSKDAFDKYVQQLRTLSLLRKEKKSNLVQTLSNMGLISEWIDEIAKDEVLMRSFWLQEMKKDKALVERLAREKENLRAEGKAEGKVEGKAEGKAEGKVEGRNEGRYEKAVQMAEKCLAKGMPVEEVAELTELPLEEVKAIAARMGK